MKGIWNYTRLRPQPVIRPWEGLKGKPSQAMLKKIPRITKLSKATHHLVWLAASTIKSQSFPLERKLIIQRPITALRKATLRFLCLVGLTVKWQPLALGAGLQVFWTPWKSNLTWKQQRTYRTKADTNLGLEVSRSHRKPMLTNVT